MNRRIFIVSSACTALALTSVAQAKESSLPKAQDLRVLTKHIATNPIVLLASLPGCPYCELVRRSYLMPYKTEQGLQSWQLDTTDHGTLIDFAGQKTAPAAWVKAMRIKIAPTVLFLDSKGNEIAPRLEGVAVPDFYGSYLDARLTSARQKL